MTAKLWVVWLHYGGDWHVLGASHSEKGAHISAMVGGTHHKAEMSCIEPLRLSKPIESEAEK